MQIKACSVTLINSGILRFVGIVYDTVFAVLYIGVYFYVVVCAEYQRSSSSSSCAAQRIARYSTRLFSKLYGSPLI